MFQVIDMDHKKFKTEMVGKMRDMEKKNDEMFEQNVGLKEVKEQLEESNTRLEVATVLLLFCLSYSCSYSCSYIVTFISATLVVIVLFSSQLLL